MIFPSSHYHRKAFSLVEVLLAVFILGIGLIMVATVFPVGANWTRQGTETSVAQVVAQNALNVIKTHYGPGGNVYGVGAGFDALPALTAGATSPLVALPSLTPSGAVNVNERCYQFGNTQPFPAANPNNCTYFWTALARRTPIPLGQTPTPAMKSFDLYILVFHKGAIEQTYTAANFPSAATEVAGCRNTATENYIPTVAKIAYNAGTYNTTSGTIVAALPFVGEYGIGLKSGTVFRQGVATVAGAITAVATPPLNTAVDTNILFSPPPDGGTTGSPLVYVYQTTITQ